jgi:tetratricopeptide (TPR) repeat protein
MAITVNRSGIRILIVLATLLAFAQISPAQGQQQQSTPPKPATSAPTLQPGAPAPADAPKIDPEEEKAYKAFSGAAAPQDSSKQIQLGEEFVQKYPQSKYDEQVYATLMQDYFNKQQLDKMYAAADKALVLNPDDVAVLVLVGWTIPHNYDPNDMASEPLLDKAENYEKHAMEVMDKLAKPANMTDEKFAKAKQDALSQAHSGLGLIYFRRQNYAESVTELQMSEKIASAPDPTDFYVMGIELNQLKRYPEAAEAFDSCAKLPGSLADRCKQNAEQAKKQPAQATPVKP